MSITTDQRETLIQRADLDAMTFDDMAPGPALPPMHPGEVLLEEFMRPAGLTARALAAQIGVPGNRVSSIVNGTRGITAETALRLAGRFGTSAELWMNLQSAYDLGVARASWGNKAA